jgi:hypothetical protein
MKQMFCGNDGQLSIRRVMAGILFGFAVYFMVQIDVNDIHNNLGEILLIIFGAIFSLLGLATAQNTFLASAAKKSERQPDYVAEYRYKDSPFDRDVWRD